MCSNVIAQFIIILSYTPNAMTIQMYSFFHLNKSTLKLKKKKKIQRGKERTKHVRNEATLEKGLKYDEKHISVSSKECVSPHCYFTRSSLNFKTVNSMWI